MNEKCLEKNTLQTQKLIILSLTKRCNLHCAYCRVNPDNWYDKLSGGSEIIDLEKNRWDDLAEFCEKNGVAEVLLTGGEPVLYPYFEELCLFLNSKKIKFSIHTNGASSKWNNIIDFLNSKSIKPDIYLSIELFEDLQKKLRGTIASYDFLNKIISNGFWVELKVTLTQLLLSKKDILVEKLEEWADKGVSSIRFQPVVEVSKDTPREILLDESFVQIIKLLEECQFNNPKVGKILRHSKLSYLSVIDYLRGKPIHDKCVNSCCAKDQIVFITPDYQFLNCKSLWGKDESKSCKEVFDLVCCGFLD